jgi:PEGA domain
MMKETMSSSDQAVFQPIHNPYIVGNPIKDRRMFFGREDDFAYIQKKVSGAEKGGLLVLCGSRRSGKTSILFQVINGRLGPDFFPVLIDMQAMAVENDLDFLVKVGQGIVDAVGDSKLSLDKDFLAQPAESSFARFERFIVKVNERLEGRKLILLFDEYEIFESHIEKKLISTMFLNLLANWIDYKGGAFVVFTGSDRLDERTASYWSGFLTKALYRGVSYLSKRDTLRLIREPVADTVRYADDVPEQIWFLTAGQAFYTQVYCQALVDHLNERREYDVTSEDLEQVTNEIVENPLPQMIFSWNSMLPMEKIALSIIGEISKAEIRPVSAKDVIAFANKEKIGYDIDLSKLNEVLEKLFHHDLLDKDSDGSTYTFKMDLWRRWIGRMHSIWQVVDELATGEGVLGEGLVKSRPRRARLGALIPASVAVVIAASVLIYRNIEDNNRVALASRVDSTSVAIQTDPPGAWVFLNERRMGLSPMNALAAVGPTFMRIELDGYKALTDTLDLKKDEPLDTSFTLVQQIGNIEVSSSPSRADIYLDGERTGLQTPSTLKGLAVGKFHRVGLRLDQYAQQEWVNVRVQEDSTIALAHAFSKLQGQVRFETEPSGAEIVIDGAVEGKTPAVVFLNYGNHDLVFRLSGYEAVKNTITVASTSQTIRETFTKLPPGTLVLKILPYADVYVGGVLKARQLSRYEAKMDPDQYEIELRNPRFDTYTIRVEIVSNETTERTVNMGTVKDSQ